MKHLAEFGLGAFGGLLAFWLFEGFLARLGGPLFILAGTSGLAVQEGAVPGILAVVAGVMLWFAGHWHYALRHRQYRSRLAGYVLSRAPAALDATRLGDPECPR
jgi:hypothetical protein